MPLFVLQDSLCSVYAAGVFPGSGRRLCAVNVKLTMRLAVEAELPIVREFPFVPVVSKGRHWRTQVATNSLVIARGGVG